MVQEELLPSSSNVRVSNEISAVRRMKTGTAGLLASPCFYSPDGFFLNKISYIKVFYPIYKYGNVSLRFFQIGVVPNGVGIRKRKTVPYISRKKVLKVTNSIYGVSTPPSPVSAYSAQQSVKKPKTDLSAALTGAKEWKPVEEKSSLIPEVKAGYGVTVGNVNLSDKAKEYYAKLKEKFHGMDFILVSADMKDQVESHASLYGSSAKPVVLIDDEKIERMANDPEYAKKYEGIIESSMLKLEAAKNSLAATGASIKNFGMSVGEDGKTSFFAVIEKAGEAADRIREKKLAEHKEAKAKEKKKAEKEEAEERIEKISERNREYVEFASDSLEDLIDKVSKYAFDSSESLFLANQGIGQSIDFKG